VEDQSADSGDLTAAASVPQGKAARNRHRLPRQQKAQQLGTTVDAADEAHDAPEATDVSEATEHVEPSAASSEAAPLEAPTRKRRMPWRRAKGGVAATPDAPSAEPEPARVEPETPPAEAATDAYLTDAYVTDAGEGPAGGEPAPVLVAHRPAGRGLKVVAVAVSALFVAAAAFAGATIQPYLADRAAVQTKFSIAETAANAITTLWTYTPDDMDKLPERSARYLGGDFASDYKRYIDAIVAPNKQAQVSNSTQVLGAAVESLTPTEATAIVYTNSVATSPVTKGIPSLRYLSYRLTMKRQDDRWLITQMVAVTKLDLTPQL
jgi:Mce-associated membrane protein